MQSDTEYNTTQPETIYDHPLYYDILFGWDRTQEADFYASMFEHFHVSKREGVLEVACGTGQVGRVLAQRGWRLTGLDSREPMLAFLRQEASAQQLSIDTLCADMADFHCEDPLGAAFNPLASMLLLSDDARVDEHFASMASAIRPGGVYIVDLGFDAEVSPDAQTTDESWEETRGPVTVRAANDAVYVEDAGTHRILPWGVGTHLRAVTSQWLEDRVRAANRFSIESWHPEAGRTPASVSRWSVQVQTRPPVFGRAMVVLRRL